MFKLFRRFMQLCVQDETTERKRKYSRNLRVSGLLNGNDDKNNVVVDCVFLRLI